MRHKFTKGVLAVLGASGDATDECLRTLLQGHKT